MPRTVAIVLSPDYAEQLGKLAFHTPVWIVDTPENRAAAEEAWRSAVEWPHITVTLFRPFGEPPARDDWRALVEQILFLEKSVDAIDVIGTPLAPVARTALGELGFERLDETKDGFRARKQ